MICRCIPFSAKIMRVSTASGFLRNRNLIRGIPKVVRNGDPNCDCSGEMEGLGCGCNRKFSTFTEKNSTINKIVINELDKIAKSKESIDVGLVPPRSLKIPDFPPPEHLSAESEPIVEAAAVPLDVPKDDIGVVDYIENIFAEVTEEERKASDAASAH